MSNSEQTSDIVVVGAGTAGMPCAIAAAEEGATVVVVEKTDEVGGTYHRSGGELSGAGSRRQRLEGVDDDSPELHFEEVWEKCKGLADPDLLRLAVEEAPKSIDWLDDLGFPFVPYPAMYLSHEQYERPRAWVGESAGMSILFTIMPVWNEHVRAGRIVPLLEHEMTELLVEDGAVVGVRAKGPDGEVTLRAPNVVLATGGYANNPELYAELTPGAPELVSGSRESSTGDGIVAARHVGAQVRGAEYNYSVFGPLEFEPRRVSNRIASANLVAIERPPREIHVNVHGERFRAEDEPSADVRQADVMRQPGREMWLVFDEASIEAGEPLVRQLPRKHDPELAFIEGLWNAQGLRQRAMEGLCVWMADDIRELAARAGIDPDGLATTVAEWNESVRNGRDDRFGRKVLDHAVEQPPFYAVRCRATTPLTWGGLAVDRELRVLDGDGAPIPGLHAAGELLGAAQLMGDTILGGLMVTSCISFGRFLGRRLAGVVTAGPVAATENSAMNATAPSFDRSEPQLFNVFDVPWRSYREHEAVAGLEARLVTRDARNGAATYLVRIPAGWRRTITVEECTAEFFLLEGDLATGGRRVRAGGFLAIPQACGPADLVSSGGAVAYVFVTPDLLLPAYTAGIHSTNVWQQPWVHSSLVKMRHGTSAKSLRVPDVRTSEMSGTASGMLRLTMMAPGFAEPRSEVHHAAWEEIIVISGDMVMSDRGLMAPGSVMSNPPKLWHFPGATQRGCIFLFHTNAPMDVEYQPYNGGFDIVTEYLETTSWLEPIRHETRQSPETFLYYGQRAEPEPEPEPAPAPAAPAAPVED